MFRRLSLEYDFGIDGYIDIIDANGGVTGRSIAVQIKSGPSFFANETSTGITFYGQRKHLNYYSNLPMPLIIVLFDPLEKRCYWSKFDVHDTEPTQSGWKITIPKRNIFGLDAKDRLLGIAGPTYDTEDAIEEYWAVNEMLGTSDYVFYAVDRSDVASGNTVHLEQFSDRIMRNEKLRRALQGRVDIAIAGYDNDPRELFEIAEVVAWYVKADAFFNWFYFSCLDWQGSGLMAYWSCVCSAHRAKQQECDSGKVTIELDIENMLTFLQSNFSRFNELADNTGISNAENEIISIAIIEFLGIPNSTR